MDLPHWAVPLIPALTALALSSLGLTGPAFWRDEAATVSMVRRPVSEMARVFEQIDVVHALYYLILRPWAAVFGTGEIAVRAPSVLATALAAAGVAVLARRCADPATGLVAGLLYACGVTVTRYAQEARPYAMVAAVAVLAGYLLVRAAESRSWRWFAGYGLATAVLGLLNLYALLLVPAHGVTLLVSRPGGRAGRRWSLTIGLVLAGLFPFALAALGQIQQILWIPPVDMGTPADVAGFLAGDGWLAIPVLLLAAAGLTSGVARVGIRALALPWLLLPPAVLLGVSVLYHPVYVDRYVVLCLPAVSLLAAAGLVRLVRLGRRGRAASAVAVTVLLVLSVPAHAEIRRQDGRLDDLRTPATILRDQARPGDAVLYLERVLRWDAAAYPWGYRKLDDVTLDQDAVRAGNLKGGDIADPEELRRRLREAGRVWVMTNRSVPEPAPERVLERQRILFSTGPYAEEGTWTYRGGRLSLLVRRPGGEPGIGSCGACVRWSAGGT